MEITALTASDWPAAARIYGQGIEEGDATFETRVPGWAAWDAAHLPEPRLAARDEGGLCGWAALSPASTRDVYRGVAEVSVYVARRARGRGVGRTLLSELVRRSEAAGLWTLQASVFP